MSILMIPDALWQRYGARVVHLAKGETLFDQGTTASSFYQVKIGRVKMVSYNEHGREFVQGMFTEGQSFGEPPFFNDVPYPAAAMAVTDSEVWKCPREGFLRLLAEHPAIHLELTKVLSGRLVYKSMMLAEIAVEEAEHRLTTLIEYLRSSDPAAVEGPYRVPFTRQQLADMTGLRVETVVRSIKAMEQGGALEITDGKIVWHGAASKQMGSERCS
jgi:CRP-like cAMP-binding protein